MTTNNNQQEKRYQRDALGIDHQQSKADNTGKSVVVSQPNSIDKAGSIAEDNQRELSKEAIITKNETNIKQANDEATTKVKDLGLPTPVEELMSTGFGQPSKDHSFTQEAAGETILFQFLKVGVAWLTVVDLANLLATHPLVAHLYKMMQWYKSIDFTKLQDYLNYASQRRYPGKIKLFMACLFHYDLSVANAVSYVRNNYA